MISMKKPAAPDKDNSRKRANWMLFALLAALAIFMYASIWVKIAHFGF